MKIVIVTGGRNYTNVDAVRGALHAEKPDMVVQGGAPGADKLAARWARAVGVQLVTFEAMWDVHGKAAGSKRNEMMVRFGEAMVLTDDSHSVRVIAFPGGRGTEDVIKRAEDFGFPVLRIRGDEG